jgi:3-oxoacyl-[acyl-carrier-protein] synthase II
MRRVVVTGLGAITPLGVGIRHTWKRLLASESGLGSVAHLEPAPRWRELPSTVAGIVPQGSKAEGKWQASDWLDKGDERRMAKFTQYAIAATEMALVDAGWRPHTQEDRDTTGVCLGSGIGNLEELYNTSITYDRTVSYIGMPIARSVLRSVPRVTRRSLPFSSPNSLST